jgi:hypothetical protein
MTLRPLNYAAASHLEDVNYLVAHLKAEAKTANIVPGAEVAAAALKAQLDDWNDKRNTAVEAQSALANLDETVHIAVRNANQAILDDLERNRRSAKFLTYFPRGYAAICRAPYHDELRAVRSLAERCAQDTSPNIQAQAELLRAAAEVVNAAVERRDQALVAEDTSFGQLQIRKVQSIEACRSARHRLIELFPNDGERVRSFFRPVGRKGRTTPAAGTDPNAQTTAAPQPVALTQPVTPTQPPPTLSSVPASASGSPTPALAPAPAKELNSPAILVSSAAA